MKSPKNLIKYVVTLFVLGVFAWYISANWDKFQEISLSNPLFIIPAVIFYVLNIYCMGNIVELAIEPHGVKLKKHEVFGLSALTRFSKQITPGYVGSTVRAVYLKKNYGVSYAKFSSSLILSSILQFVVSGILAVSLYFSYSRSFDDTRPVFVIAFSLLAFAGLLYLPVSWFAKLLEKKNLIKNKLVERLHAVVLEYDNVRKHPKFFYRSFLWIIVTLAASSITLAMFYYALGYQIGVAEVLFINALTSWTTIFSITPSAIGIREGLMVIGAGLMDVPIPETIAVSVLMRIVMFLVVASLSSYYAPKLLNTTLSNVTSFRKQ